MARTPAPAGESAPRRRFWPSDPRTRWWLAAIAGAAFVLRVYRLESIPIAGDESEYLRWGEIIVDQKQWFISLLDGKPPLSYWLYALMRLAWPPDPLYGARLVSVLAGVLSTVGVFAMGRRLAGDVAGLTAAFLYAFFPYALLYDRLAYAESLVNLAGVSIVYTSIACFDRQDVSWKRGLAPGLALGLGLFTKSTALLFAFFPLLAALWLKRGRGWKLRGPLAAAYGVALLFPLLGWAATPRAPMIEISNPLLQQSSLFVAPAELLRHPLLVAPGNFRLLGEYLRAYLTIPLAAAVLISLAYLIYKRSLGALVVFAVSLLPLVVQIFVVVRAFPTRYPFPHVWPCFVLVGVAAAALPWPKGRLAKAAAVIAMALVAAGPPAAKALAILRAPQQHLYPEDARTFLGSGPSAGFGIREAMDYLLAEAAQGPFTVFTDAVWGPPADAVFTFVHGRRGIQAYEAWWTTVGRNYPIIPPVPVEVLKSQYEPVAAGVLNPPALGRVYYVTETFYNPPAAVHLRQPGAERVASFPKPNGRNSIDIYRLR